MSPFLGRRRRPPLHQMSPESRALLAMAQQSTLTRRALLGGGAAVGAGLALSACAPPLPPERDAAMVWPTDTSASDKVVKWANWTAYMDTDEKTRKHPTLEAFSKRTGLAVTYAEDIDDNDTYFTKIRPQLQSGKDIDRDLFTPTDWMAGRVIRDQLCQPLDLMALPHVVGNMLDALRNVSFDPGRKYSITWQSGFAGIGYNKAKVGRELKTLDDLFTDDLKGKITVLSEFRDTVGVVMAHQGVDIAGDWGRTEFEKAVDWIAGKIDEGYIRKVKGNDYMNDLKSGNALAGITWSGDIFTLAADTGDDNWTFELAESGGTLWSDNMMIPSSSHRQANAHKLMDYYYEPAVAAELAAWVTYISPVKGAQQEMEKIDPELAQSPLIFPTDEYLTSHNVKGFRALTAREDSEYSAIWAAKVLGS